MEKEDISDSKHEPFCDPDTSDIKMRKPDIDTTQRVWLLLKDVDTPCTPVAPHMKPVKLLTDSVKGFQSKIRVGLQY